jgi:hypothetical protein
MTRSLSANNRKPRRFGLETLESRQVLSINLSPIGGFESGVFNSAAVENIAYHAPTQRVFTADQSPFEPDPDGDGPLTAKAGRVGVLDVSDPTAPAVEFYFDVSAYGLPTGLATHGNMMAVAIPNGIDETRPGVVAFFNANATHDTGPIKVVEVGPVPDHLMFTPDGKKVLTANEGQPCSLEVPEDCFEADPEGSMSIIDISRGLNRAKEKRVSFAPFTNIPGLLPALGVRVLPDRPAGQSLEPEYIGVDPSSNLAWVTLQENNAIAIVSLDLGRTLWVKGLGTKDHSLPGNGLDPNDGGGGTPEDPNSRAIGIANWPVHSYYQPDGIAVFTSGNQLYLATANEGDIFDGEDARVAEVDLDDAKFPNEADLKRDSQLGRLVISEQFGDTDGDGDVDKINAFGARGFTIWSPTLNLVSDSGDDFEQVTAAAFPANFNASNTVNTLDNRSDDKGPEPTTIVVGEIAGRKYAFTTVERTGGIMVHDITTPASPTFVQYINTRNFAETPAAGKGGDLHPEGLVFVPANKSPNGKTLLIAGYQVSGSVRIFQIDAVAPSSPAAVVVTSASAGHSTAVDRGEARLSARRTTNLRSDASQRAAAADRAIDSVTQSLAGLRHRGRAPRAADPTASTAAIDAVDWSLES